MTEKTPATKDAILAEIVAYLEENVQGIKGPLGPETRLEQDLQLDSVDTMGLLARVEDALDVTLPLDAFDGAKTLGEIAERAAGIAGRPREA